MRRRPLEERERVRVAAHHRVLAVVHDGTRGRVEEGVSAVHRPWWPWVGSWARGTAGAGGACGVGRSGARIAFMTQNPECHHQFVLFDGRPDELPYNPVNQISFRVDSLATLREMHRGLKSEAVKEVVTLTHGNALNITCLSYAGTLNFGFTGARDIPAVRDTLGRLAAMEAGYNAMIDGQIEACQPFDNGFMVFNRRYLYAAIHWAMENHSGLIDIMHELMGGGQFQFPASIDLLDEAAQCLRLLSGRNHRVYTAICLVTPKEAFRQRLIETKVRFKRLSEDDIQAYIGSGEWRGKAGGYAVQGIAGSFVVKMVGSYTNVVGLPLAEAFVRHGHCGALGDGRV